MGKYGDAAIKATSLVRRGGYHPCDAWKTATKRQFPTQKSAREKGCPRAAYLGLCEEGIVSGVARGNYTRSVLNKQYALEAVQLLCSDRSLASDKNRLWKKALKGEDKTENGQMDVVITLWRNRLIKCKT